MINAAIFDIDGTLVDSVDLHAEAWRAAFKKFGKTVPFADIRCQIGKGADQLLPVFWSAEELSKFGEDLEEYRSELFKKEYLPRVKAFSKVRQLSCGARAAVAKACCSILSGADCGLSPRPLGRGYVWLAALVDNMYARLSWNRAVK
jgi:beta-phosphoglucomutase-like phosphatase (HAD superfamily)